MPVILITALVFTTGVGTAVVAENSLPGDALYAVKVNVNEEAVSALSFSSEAKANWEARRAERRLEKLEELAAEGKLKTEVIAQVRENFDPDNDGCLNERETAANGRFIDESLDPNVCHDAATHTGKILIAGTAEIKDASNNDVQRVTHRGSKDIRPAEITYRFETADGTFKEVVIPSITFALLETLSDQSKVQVKGGESEPTTCDLIGSLKCNMSKSSRIIFPTLNGKEFHIVFGNLDAFIEKHTDTLGSEFYNLQFSSKRSNTVLDYGAGVIGPKTLPAGVRLDFGLPGSKTRVFLGGTSFDDIVEPQAGDIKVSCAPSTAHPAGDQCFYERAEHFLQTKKSGVTKELISTGQQTLFNPATNAAVLGPVVGAGEVTFASSKTVDLKGHILADFDSRPNQLILAPSGRGENMIFNGATCAEILKNPRKLVTKTFLTREGRTVCASK